jgi:preprotein translocase subunit SecA
MPKAKHIFKLNKDYIVLKNKVLIVDEFMAELWKIEDGVLEFMKIEIKECVTLGGETQTKSSITYQNFLLCIRNLLG